MTAEINPWTLFLGDEWETVERLGSYALSFWVPEHHTDHLWRGMRDGTIDLIATDHAPHLPEEKEPGWEDGWAAHTGTPSLEFYGPLLLDAAHSGRLTLEEVVRLACARPAEIFRLATKGRIEVGRDADLALVDIDRRWVITDDQVESKCGWTPYAGRPVVGAIDTTILRGRGGDRRSGHGKDDLANRVEERSLDRPARGSFMQCGSFILGGREAH